MAKNNNKSSNATRRAPRTDTTSANPGVAADTTSLKFLLFAEHARREYRTGEKLALAVADGTRTHSTLNSWERDLHQQFHSGKLQRQMVAANKAFGQSVGVETSLPIEQMAALQLSSQGHWEQCAKRTLLTRACTVQPRASNVQAFGQESACTSHVFCIDEILQHRNTHCLPT